MARQFEDLEKVTFRIKRSDKETLDTFYAGKHGMQNKVLRLLVSQHCEMLREKLAVKLQGEKADDRDITDSAAADFASSGLGRAVFERPPELDLRRIGLDGGEAEGVPGADGNDGRAAEEGNDSEGA